MIDRPSNEGSEAFLWISSCTVFDASCRDIEDITGCKSGRTTSLSRSMNETAEGGGIGETFRSVPREIAKYKVRRKENSVPTCG